jgi:cyclophilin family peptidyl-prolyl cis-trans isomerase
MRRRQIVVGLVVAALVLSSGGAVLVAIISSLSSSSPTTSSLPTRPSLPDSPAIELALPQPGVTATEDVACPAADGSAVRTTSFIGSPPVCLATTPEGVIDGTVTYRAIVTTSAGPLTYLLTTAATPQTVNSFVVLARYGYWDGAPFDSIVPLAWAETGGRFAGGSAGDPGPGWTVSRESPGPGMVSTPGMLGMATTSNGDSDPGRLVVALGEGAGNLPVATTFFGVLLDGTATLTALQRAGTLTGSPSQAVTIERIVIEQVNERD